MQLLDGSKVAEYKVPVDMGIELRKYQRDGVSWLAFLARYQLHGLLCDGASPPLHFPLPPARVLH